MEKSHCGIGTHDDTSLKNCDISCNTRCCNSTDCYVGSLNDVDKDTVCERGCSDRLPCPSSPRTMYCDYYKGEYGTCQECVPDEDKQKEKVRSACPLPRFPTCCMYLALTCLFCSVSFLVALCRGRRIARRPARARWLRPTANFVARVSPGVVSSQRQKVSPRAIFVRTG